MSQADTESTGKSALKHRRQDCWVQESSTKDQKPTEGLVGGWEGKGQSLGNAELLELPIWGGGLSPMILQTEIAHLHRLQVF